MNAIEAAQRAVDLAADPCVDDGRAQAAVGECFRATSGISLDEANEVVATLGPGILVPGGRRAALIATLCGAMVEGGADPAPMIEPLLRRIEAVVPDARRFFEAFAATVPKDATDVEGRFDAARPALASEMPAGAAAWDALE